jgi:hypothetical protein
MRIRWKIAPLVARRTRQNRQTICCCRHWRHHHTCHMGEDDKSADIPSGCTMCHSLSPKGIDSAICRGNAKPHGGELPGRQCRYPGQKQGIRCGIGDAWPESVLTRCWGHDHRNGYEHQRYRMLTCDRYSHRVRSRCETRAEPDHFRATLDRVLEYSQPIDMLVLVI